MKTIDIHSLQEKLLKTDSPLVEKDLPNAEASVSEIFQAFRNTVRRLYEAHADVLRFVIESTAKASNLYCITIMKDQIIYLEGFDEHRKTIVCDLLKENFSINHRPAPSDFSKTFQKYLSQAFHDLGDKSAVLYEEAAAE
jgi:hypothetical protein